MSDKSEGFIERMEQRLESEFRTIEKDTSLSTQQKVDKMIRNTAVLCAAVAVQPLPFADMPILTAIQTAMGYKLGLIHGIDMTKERPAEILKAVLGAVGLGWLAQQAALGLYKFLPFVTWPITIVTVYSLTYGIGRAMNLYFVLKKQGRTPTAEEIRKAFEAGKIQAKKEDIKKAVKEVRLPDAN
jgi:uncharacterized protein (DUF697 family)